MTDKPAGPYELYAVAEATPFAHTIFAPANAVRHTLCTFGDGVRERALLDVSRPDRGSHAEHLGRYTDVPFTIETPLIGSGTAGTPGTSFHVLTVDGAGLSEVDNASISDTYESDVACPVSAISLYRVERNALFGEYLTGGIIQQIQLTLNKKDIPKLKYTGLAARKQEFMATTLGAAIVAVDATAMTLTTGKCIRAGGDNAATLTGLNIYVLIDAEVVKITEIVKATGVCVIVRGQFSTTPATHLIAAPVTPYKPTPVYSDAGVMIGAMDWTAVIAAAINLQSFQYTLDTGRAFDEIASGQSASCGIHAKKLAGTGSFSYLLSQARYNAIAADLDAGTDIDGAIICGTTAGSIWTFNFDLMRLIDGVPKDLTLDGAPLEITQTFRTLDTATALRGQFQLVCT
jgi:hypothetical protein